jgi:Cohesin domain
VRKLLLIGAVLVTVGLVAYQPARNDATKGAPREAAAASSVTASGKGAEGLQVPERRSLGQVRGELFGAPPPPPQAAKTGAASAPAVQVAPPMPYRFAGRVRKGAEEEFLISKGDLIFAVKEGDTIDGTYKVVAVRADGIELVYMPLGTPERIVVSSALDVEVARPVAAAAPAAVPVSDGRPAQLRWDGPKEVRAGGNFSVALRVSTQETLRAAPMQLRYSPGVLEAVEVRPGKFIGKSAFSYRVSADGSIFVGALMPATAPGADAELVVVTFRPLKPGAVAELSMSALTLQGTAGRAIAHEQPAAFRATIQ